MTFLEWEIYSQWELEDAIETTKVLITTGTGILPPPQLSALSLLVNVTSHVAERGSLDEATNKWKVE
tara:strand:+ start:1882 stop:2082 length:201 start_codon:yes stop_codon:yes gene_type:complete